MTDTGDITINVPVMARVEGEGALELTIRNKRIEALRLRIFEPPRFFEKLLEGRDCAELPDLVARICGICPVAYQMTAVQAVEAILGVEPDPWVRDMRRVMYCGEWLQSHALHIHLLAAPDFLGYEHAFAMAAEHPEIVRRGLRLQALGNRIMALFGARSVHPVGVCIGGFHHAPAVADIAALRAALGEALADAEALLAWTGTLTLPAETQSFISVALRDTDGYPIERGRIASDNGIDIGSDAFQVNFHEHQVPHSTALHSTLDGEPYLVGPLARLNLNRERLPAAVRVALDATGVRFPSANPFHGIVARAAEILYALHESLRLLADYRLPESPHAAWTPRAGVGYGATEAPRGLLWHRYQLDEAGHVAHAIIVPPTSQNQARIEADLRIALTAFGLDRPAEALRAHGERVIRNYDPCISCSTHFLKLKVDRS
jgi:coenzyme F420-reducing hydrogenase alpha subunit